MALGACKSFMVATAAVADHEFIVIVHRAAASHPARMVAGLEDIGRRNQHWRPGCQPAGAAERDIAMVFQNYALYPHMSVFDNMAYGLNQRKCLWMKSNNVCRRPLAFWS
jgi:ABC-type sugar transport system ATPase subunit